MPSVRRASVPIYALATAIVIHLVIVLVLYEECVYVCVCVCRRCVNQTTSLNSTGVSFLISLVEGECSVSMYVCVCMHPCVCVCLCMCVCVVRLYQVNGIGSQRIT